MLSLSPIKPRLPKLLLLVVIIILGIYLVEVLRENESIKRYLKNEHKFEFKSFLSSRKNYSKILIDEKVELVNSTTTTEEPKRDNNRVFCLIKSYLNNYRNNVTTVIYDVWGRKCDEHRVIMMIPEELRTPDWKIGEEYEVLGQPFNILQPKLINESTHMNITDKIYSSIVSIYKRFPDYEWYYLVDDDSYVNVANLKQFLADKNESHPITYGFEFKTNVRQGYHSGGSGYVLSNEAFRRIGQQLDTNYTFCPNSGVEDLDVNRCLRELGVEMGVSVDERGRQRFLVLDLMRHYLGAFPNWLYRFSLHPLRKGVDCCSDSIIAVHYMNPKDVLRLDIAIEIQINVVEMYKKHIDMNRNVTFRDVFRNYISLKIFENQKNIENSTLNGIF